MKVSKLKIFIPAMAVAFLFTGCDSFFEVENPTDIESESLNDESMIPSLANTPHASIADDYDIAVQYGGLPGDGLIHSSTNQGNLRLDNGTFSTFTQRAEDLYNSLAAGQWTAREATDKLRALVDNPESDARVAEGEYWDGLARVTLADLYERVTFDGGEPHSPTEVYQMAIGILETAASIGRSAGDMEIVAAAEGTLARVYRSLYYEGDGSEPALFDEAAAHAQAALDADADFRFDAQYAPPGSENGMVDATHNTFDYDVMDPRMANIEDPVSGQPDPRVQHSEFKGIGTQNDSLYAQNKYTSRDQGIPVSRWEEAALILAEHQLLEDNLQNAVDRINDVRGDAGLPDFSSSDAQEIEDQLIYERRVEFWLEMRRWQDMRYYGIMPTRWTPGAQQAGLDRRFPIALRECQSNPNVDC